ncbi:hypothetical protein BH09ACT12_BH09ACT12_11180 [soil metagenome]
MTLTTDFRRSDPQRRWQVRVALPSGIAVALVVAALALPTSGTPSALTLRQENEVIKGERGLPHIDPPGTPLHTHDPAFKNELARGGEALSAATTDPTTRAEARDAAAYVESERELPDPKLTSTSIKRTRTFYPANRYDMAGGCYTLRTAGGDYVKQRGDTIAVTGVGRRKASRFTFQATKLGSYLLYSTSRHFLAGNRGVAVIDDEPSRRAEWIVKAAKPTKVGAKKGQKIRRFKLGLRNGRGLTAREGTLRTGHTARPFVLEHVQGCAKYPEAQVNVKGAPFTGVSDIQEVRGFVDAHTHGMAFEFLGGDIHCGRPWHKWGVAYALVDCPDHTATGGYGAALETVLSGEVGHDPVGWPTFKDWPAPESLTHEGTYYKWLERSWRGGQRLFVNLLVENNQLCQLYPIKHNSCDDMDSIRLQAKDMYRFQDYIDAQWGGPGKGFYRIVTSPFEARKVINEGKLAVVMGIETSVPFGCTFTDSPGGDVSECSAADITRQIDQMHRLGVRQMELVNKFDNSLAGVAGDAGATGIAINAANFLETGTFWDMQHCEPADGESADNPQVAFPDIGAEQQDALFGAIGSIFGGILPAIPVYGPPAHCNQRDLTTLGEHTIRERAKRGIIFDPDHLSVISRQSALDVIDDLGYPGVISSHSWSTPDSYPRIYEDGGFITPYAGDSTGFVDKWRRHVGWADKRFYWGIGYGADINGLGAQGDPRGRNVANKVTYPIRGLGGVKVNKQHAGKRVYDINADGVAQYGLYPDWIEDLTQVADSTGGRGSGDGAAIFDDMSRGAEAYLQMWERAYGIAPDSCRNPDLRKSVGQVTRLIKKGMSTTKVMTLVGQPFERLGSSYGVCATTSAGAKKMVHIDFSTKGLVTGIRA